MRMLVLIVVSPALLLILGQVVLLGLWVAFPTAQHHLTFLLLCLWLIHRCLLAYAVSTT